MTYPAHNPALPAASDAVDSRNQLIEQYLPYVKRIVQRIAAQLPPHIDTEDLLHAGIIGLIEAVDRFDASRNIKLSTYAAFRIRGAVLTELRNRDYLNRGTRRKLRELETLSVQLENQLGRPADEDELANALGMNLEKYYELKHMAGLMFIRLEELGLTAVDYYEQLIYEISTQDDSDVNNPFNHAAIGEFRHILGRCIAELSQKEQTVLALYYQEELTMKEIGAVLDVTESRISQIHSQSVCNLRKKLTRAGYGPKDR